MVEIIYSLPNVQEDERHLFNRKIKWKDNFGMELLNDILNFEITLLQNTTFHIFHVWFSINNISRTSLNVLEISFFFMSNSDAKAPHLLPDYRCNPKEPVARASVRECIRGLEIECYHKRSLLTSSLERAPHATTFNDAQVCRRQSSTWLS